MKSAKRWLWLAAVLAILAAGTFEAVLWRHRVAAMAAKNERKKKKSLHGDHRPAQSVVVRSGLPNLLRKMDAREPITLAFIGGSITFNAGNGGFISEIPAWLIARFPGLRVQTINAGISATGSDFGAQRVDRDVLVHRPDVVFVEFAVNDAARESQADMERLVRKIEMSRPAPEIVLLYAISKDELPTLESGEFSRSAKQHETVAAHYNLPTVALGYEAARKIRVGEWTWADFSKDNCHPTTKGYESYNSDIAPALAALLEAGRPVAKTLPPPLKPDLVVYPPPAIAAPQPAPRPMLDDAGAPASQTYELPLFGVQWIGAPEFPAGAEAVWQLYSRAPDPAAPLDATVGLNRHEWRLQEWFDETRCFTGRTSLPLAHAREGSGNVFGANPFDESVLVWRAPSAGNCIIHVAAASI
jgi:lysophospholipase L1-like esterase